MAVKIVPANIAVIGLFNFENKKGNFEKSGE